MHIEQLTPEFLTTRNELLRVAFQHNRKERDYPLILNNSELRFSFCGYENKPPDLKTLVCHANLWPRTVLNSKKQPLFEIGLIGNVATHPDFRKRGFIRELLEHIQQEAQQKQLAALFLWSDLTEFYHKLGFVSVGKEVRYFLNKESLQISSIPGSIEVINADNLSEELYHKLLSLRHPTACFLKRSLHEYKELLKIPETVLLVYHDKEGINAFGIVGRGQDMIGVVHEWGGKDPMNILHIASHILEKTDWPELILLSPQNILAGWDALFSEHSFKVETHNMAFMKPLIEDKRLEQIFFWGLDSI